ncbi:GNAT family N-acetyltransferase [Rhizobium paknamense]|uniref:RimJ/RimL family protein N-acetyltransferase n=1 Tax=Rhizobium paknamense TaxID=1206817 RepID=A0ABU0ID99_9HYPH|nr:GNAT family protein [Rhizobium paknamense]MDQ0456224.1 RimJ/RimL family protein N-acetyltransferase [Rhizobium paknamense]
MQDLKTYKVEPPGPVRLEGRFVTVEPFRAEDHVQALWEAFGGLEINPTLEYFTQPYFSGIEDFAAWLQSVIKGGWIPHVFRDRSSRQVVGMASYMRADPANGVVEVGGVAHSPAMKRSPLSTEAHYLMARHVFETLGYRRYEWKCDNRNAPSKATALRYGFAFEGIFRQHMISKGTNRDTAWFSIIDSEWPLVRAGFDAWLSPENFDADGQQKRRLEDLRAELTADAGVQA